jgi:phosphoserine aminotransferase
MSSDILSGPQDINRYDLVYAHAQKTIGTAGVTIVIMNERMRQSVVQDIPPFFDYRVHAAAGSNFHTPPVFAIYVVDCMLDWLEVEVGGLDRMGEINAEKARLLYDFIDGSTLFTSSVQKSARSLMNVVFDIEDTGLAQRFSQEALAQGFMGLDGHRTRGGYRASLYNAVTQEEVCALTEFMRHFERKS